MNSLAMVDLRNAMGAQEAYHTDHQTYTNSVDNLSGAYGLASSENVVLSMTGSASVYTITTYHTSGDKTYSFSGPGGTIISN